MPLVVRRKLSETWREAVALRTGDGSPALLRFDELCREGREEAEAAYRVLADAGRLWVVDEPGTDAAAASASGEVPAV